VKKEEEEEVGERKIKMKMKKEGRR